jgi:hypothetical protein
MRLSASSPPRGRDGLPAGGPTPALLGGCSRSSRGRSGCADVISGRSCSTPGRRPDPAPVRAPAAAFREAAPGADAADSGSSSSGRNSRSPGGPRPRRRRGSRLGAGELAEASVAIARTCRRRGAPRERAGDGACRRWSSAWANSGAVSLTTDRPRPGRPLRRVRPRRRTLPLRPGGRPPLHHPDAITRTGQVFRVDCLAGRQGHGLATPGDSRATSRRRRLWERQALVARRSSGPALARRFALRRMLRPRLRSKSAEIRHVRTHGAGAGRGPGRIHLKFGAGGLVGIEFWSGPQLTHGASRAPPRRPPPRVSARRTLPGATAPGSWKPTSSFAGSSGAAPRPGAAGRPCPAGHCSHGSRGRRIRSGRALLARTARWRSCRAGIFGRGRTRGAEADKPGEVRSALSRGRPVVPLSRLSCHRPSRRSAASRPTRRSG